MMNQKKQKVLLTGAAVTLCALVMLAGTYAWTSLSQTALNVVEGTINSGGRLHDDFDGSSQKAIYVENYTSAPGTDLIVRVRLREYMELTRSGVATNYPTGAVKDDKTSWDIYELAELNGAGTDSSADHYGCSLWKFGGQKVYLPTLNKDNSSQASDLNGTKANNYKDYQDYRAKQAGDQVTVDGTVYTLEETLNATAVITMTEWETKYQSEPGAYWIYDDGDDGDGWFYWGERLSPGDATGLLLNGIQMSVEDKADSFYYGIYVESQMVTPGEIAILEDTTEQGGGGVGTKTQTLLEKLAESSVEPENISLISDYELTQTDEAIRQAEIQAIYEKMLEEEAEETNTAEELTPTEGEDDNTTDKDEETETPTEGNDETETPTTDEEITDSSNETPVTGEEIIDNGNETDETPSTETDENANTAAVYRSTGKTLLSLFRLGVQ